MLIHHTRRRRKKIMSTSIYRFYTKSETYLYARKKAKRGKGVRWMIQSKTYEKKKGSPEEKRPICNSNPLGEENC